jgi:hypothetical protein
MKTKGASFTRLAGLAAMASGGLYIAIQAIHPLDVLSSVTTPQWAITHYLGVTMAFLGIIGVAGIYAKQVGKIGWLGLVGYVLFSVFFGLNTAFQFIEAFILPILATHAPNFVVSFQGVVTGVQGEINLGALPIVYNLAGFLGYMLGGALFGIGIVRAGVLPRWAGGLLAFAAVSVLAGSMLTHPLDRILAVPMGIALIWLGYTLWSEQYGRAAETVSISESLQLSQTGAK